MTTDVTGLSPRRATTSDPIPQVFTDAVVIEPQGSFYAGTAQLFQYTFTSSTGDVRTSGWVGAGPYRVPESLLDAGKDYTYKIETMDNYAYYSPVTTKTNVGLWTFHTQASPGTPTAITLNGQPLMTDLTSSSSRPTVAATVTDADGGEVWALFTVKRDGVVVMDSFPGTKYTVAPGGAWVSSATLPYAIAAGAHYTVEVRAFDGHLASGVATADPHWFTGPPRSVREIPGSQDSETGATS